MLVETINKVQSMKKSLHNHLGGTAVLCSALLAASVFAEEPRAGGADLARGFVNPPASAKPQVWWHWMAGNVTREGITADLEAMAEAGIGGAILFDAGLGTRWGVPDGPLAFNTPEWYETVKFAATEAKRLGLELGMANCSGWANSGGPWNTPEHAMKGVVFTETEVKGGAPVSVKLPQPKDPLGFYRDIAVLAFPKPAAGYSVSDWSFKIFSNPGRKYTHPDAKEAPADAVVPRSAITDLTKKTADGVLAWDAPAGEWVVLRVGYTALNRTNGTGTKNGKGLECDKLSKEALRIHWANYVGKTVAALGPLAGTNAVLKTVLNDSYEVGTQNWTQGFEKAFAKRNGYDVTPWLPALAGRVVDSVSATETFYRDFRLTITEMFAENYAGEMRRLAHECGLQLAIEPYGELPSDDLLYGEQADIPTAEFWAKLDSPHWVRQAASIAHAKGRRFVAAESFTTNAREGRWQNTPWSMKAKCDWVYTEGLNRIIYHRFAHQPWVKPARLPGMTMGPFGVHFDRTQTWWKQAKPWLTYQQRCQYMLQEGTFVSDAAWYCPAGYLYINWGGNPHKMPTPVTDGFTYDFVSSTTLAEMRVNDGRLVLPSGQSYSFLILPEKFFELPEAGAKDLARLRAAGAKVVAFEDADAFLKTRTPDFACFNPGAKVTYIHRRTDDTDWYFVASPDENPSRLVCSFRVAGRKPELWNAETGAVEPVGTFAVKDGVTTVPLTFGPCGSWFVVFREKDAGTPPTALPPEKPQPFRAGAFELVKAEYGCFDKADQLPSDVTKQLAACVKDGRLACDSISHMAFRIQDPAENRVKELRVTYREDGVLKTASAKEHGELALPKPDTSLLDLPGEQTAVVPVAGAWTVSFPHAFAPNALAVGAPETVAFETLADWTTRPEEGVKYFSGSAVYAKTIALARMPSAGERLILDLGDVKNFGDVTVNGATVPTLWKPPFRIDVTEVVRRAGGSQPSALSLQVSVKVTNLWPNRMIGDDFKLADSTYAQGAIMERHLIGWPPFIQDGKPSPSGRFTFATWGHWTKDDALLPSGMLGPVVLRYVRDRPRHF
jgi:hypothetical protein